MRSGAGDPYCDLGDAEAAARPVPTASTYAQLMLYIGVDLAWGEGSDAKPANETGLCALTAEGRIVAAGWERGVEGVVRWILGVVAEAEAAAGPGIAIAVDAPLVVPNAVGMRESEKQVGRAYGRWKVAANPTNQALGWLAGVRLRDALEQAGFVVVSGVPDPEPRDRVMFECYPYTTLVGVEELGYDVERPRYKRLDKALPAAEARAARAVATDELVRRIGLLDTFDPPLDLASHPVTKALFDEPSPLSGPAHKHREDLLDAALCAWTASIWHRHGLSRVQVLGRDEPKDPSGRPATLVAPCRPSQRLP
ncbi:putative RNase H-like nuclease [Frondihabitans sp. PhB161]|nr:putative RNase H-like nuclease [Frondihabitans sp. PhB153]RPF08624.1 putative RNase H-like nuclease [Frondihabitans sp. PhB161]